MATRRNRLMVWLPPAAMALTAVLVSGCATVAGTAARPVSPTLSTSGPPSGSPPAAASSADGPVCATAGPVIVPTGEESSAPAAAQAALTAYACMWREMQTASSTDDWRDPALARYASGDALTELVHSLFTDHTRGVVAEGTAVIRPRVAAVIPTGGEPLRVEISDCLDDTHWLNYWASPPPSRLEDDVPGGHHATQAVATVLSGMWTISELAVQQVGTC